MMRQLCSWQSTLQAPACLGGRLHDSCLLEQVECFHTAITQAVVQDVEHYHPSHSNEVTVGVVTVSMLLLFV
jgi:hypothetical protein